MNLMIINASSCISPMCYDFTINFSWFIQFIFNLGRDSEGNRTNQKYDTTAASPRQSLFPLLNISLSHTHGAVGVLVILIYVNKVSEREISS